MKTLAIFFIKVSNGYQKREQGSINLGGNKRPDQNETRGRVERHGGLYA